MHATQKASPESFPSNVDSLYCQLSSYPEFIQRNNVMSDNEDEDGSDAESPCQLWFCVNESRDLPKLFEAMNECSALNPN
jgi:hypothetical protein